MAETYELDWDTTVATLAVLMVTSAIACCYIWYASAPKPRAAGRVTSITIYPLKSARGVSVASAMLDARGFAYDRMWMVVDAHGAFMSQRRAPKLALVEAALPTSPSEPLHLRAPGAAPLDVPVVRQPALSRSVRVWDDRLVAVDQGEAAATWLAAVLDVEGVRLVRMKDDAVRPASRKYAPRGAQAGSFSDGFPLLLASEASLAELNQRLTSKGKPALPMNRFRPNLVIGSCPASARPSSSPKPFAEDSWLKVAMMPANGPAGRTVELGVVKPCSRCKMPTIDQSTGVPDGAASAAATTGNDDDEGGGPAIKAEPTTTLRTFRSGEVLGYKKAGWKQDVFFGQNLVLLGKAIGATICVGDTVIATPRRRPGWFVRGVAGVDF